MTDFVLHNAELAARRTIEKRSLLILPARESEAFIDAILPPAKPDLCCVRPPAIIGNRPANNGCRFPSDCLYL